MHQAEIVLDMLLIPDEQFTESIVPGAGPFDDPAARRMASGRRHDFSAVAHVGNIPSGMDRDLDLAGIIPLVQAQVLRARPAWAAAD
jgi:hypothetical protein